MRNRIDAEQRKIYVGEKTMEQGNKIKLLSAVQQDTEYKSCWEACKLICKGTEKGKYTGKIANF